MNGIFRVQSPTHALKVLYNCMEIAEYENVCMFIALEMSDPLKPIFVPACDGGKFKTETAGSSLRP